jgi:predicted acylesterase/phospholipase RssA
METRKIALILAGGVSLGSYEAGVLTELLYALERLNEKAQADGGPRFVLDVMTGSSAGGMTAMLVSRIMMYDLAGRRHDLFRAWVEDIDILKLMENVPPNALLSKEVIVEIARRYIVEGANDPPTRPASFAPDELLLSLSLSNMHGVDYAIPYAWAGEGEGEAFVSTFFSDGVRFTIRRRDLPDQQTWQTIVDSAIACGNFPIAFQPQPLHREADDYPGSMQASSGFFPRNLLFLDGGLFNNEPLREAIRLSAQADGGTIDPQRVFLLVDPSVNRSYHSSDIDLNAPLEAHFVQMLNMIQGESMARDWLRTNRVNVELGWRDDLVSELARMIRSSSIERSDEVADQLHELADSIVEQKRTLFGSRYPDDYLERSLEKVERQHEDEIRSLATGDVDAVAKRKILARLVFVLNNVAGLQNKSELRLALIGSAPRETAGDQLYAFGGFFDQEWREHDYRRGRIKARKVLPGILGESYPEEQDEEGRPVKDYIIPAAWKRFPQAEMRDADPGLRAAFREVVLERISEILKRIGLPSSLVWMAKKLYISKKVDQLLEL